jgi:hypothetical protein
MSELVKVYAPSGEMFENSPVNARDLVVNAGWSYDKPRTDTAIFAVEVQEPIVISEPVIEAEPEVVAPIEEVKEEISEVVPDEVVSEVEEVSKVEETEEVKEVVAPTPAVRGRKKKS